MSIEKMLEQLGLEQKQALVYLTCLQLGKDSAFHIAEKCGLKRSTVYIKLNELNIKGLVQITKTSKAKLYQAVSPKRLLQQIDFRKKQIEESLPLLLSLYKDESQKPNIEIFEGKNALEQMNKEIFHYIQQNPTEEILSFGRIDYLERYYEKTFSKWVKQVQYKQFRTRQIFNKGATETALVKTLQKNASAQHDVRFVDEELFSNDNVICGDTMYIFSIVENNLFVIVIHNQEIIQTYKAFFDLAWKGIKKTPLS
ncbi:MAG: hypothetical protein HYV32_03540 [Candidatus Kerfeldbacteria bacterium]|nr:hypothetical protein [Candidatus Kerfeldbacteria bacterium]